MRRRILGKTFQKLFSRDEFPETNKAKRWVRVIINIGVTISRVVWRQKDNTTNKKNNSHYEKDW
jgi:hypothetical protein